MPRQLPAAIRHFIGRSAELATMTRLAGPAPRGQSPILVITGIGEVGKNDAGRALVAPDRGALSRRPLYANLRGYDPSGAPVAAGEAIRGFLAALSVPAEAIPADLDAQAALYRSLLAGKRMLIVLDNARDPAQVRPLLPGSAGCLVLVTSRSWLAGLVASEGAGQLDLAVLTNAEATALLSHRIGTKRTAAEPDAASELITLCSGLPVALVVLAARAIVRPRAALAELAAELRASRQRLDALVTGDSATDVRSVFSWSYLGLTDQAARLFRLAGLHPGADLSRMRGTSRCGRAAA